MKHYSVITLLPEILHALEYGICGRARVNSLYQLELFNPRDFTTNVHRTVDDTPYGGGPGMVLKPEPVTAAIQAAKQTTPKAPVIYLTPQGKPLTQPIISELATKPGLILLCGRYEGIDQRVIKTAVDAEYSLGDYVISGGELAACVLLDAIIRLQPGALGDETSATQDSFSHGLLDYPHYTRPESFQGQSIPEVLRSGNHGEIARWRLKQALGHTYLKRPDLLQERELSPSEQQLLNEFIDENQ